MSLLYWSDGSGSRGESSTHLHRIIRHIGHQTAEGNAVGDVISRLKQDLHHEAAEDLAFVESLLLVRHASNGGGIAKNKVVKSHLHQLLSDLVGVVRQHNGDVLQLLSSLNQRQLCSQTRLQQLWGEVQGALNYLVSVLVVMSICTGILVAKTIPAFESLFGMFGAELPEFSSLIISTSRFIGAWWFVFLPFVVLVVLPLAWVPTTVSGWRPMNTWFRWLPGIKKLYYLHSYYLVVTYSHLLLQAGVSNIAALEASLTWVNDRLELRALAERDDLFQDLVIAQNSGTLTLEMEYQQLHIENHYLARLEVLKRRAEQFGYAVGGVLIGAVLVAMYLPIFALGSLM